MAKGSPRAAPFSAASVLLPALRTQTPTWELALGVVGVQAKLVVVVQSCRTLQVCQLFVVRNHLVW